MSLSNTFSRWSAAEAATVLREPRHQFFQNLAPHVDRLRMRSPYSDHAVWVARTEPAGEPECDVWLGFHRIHVLPYTLQLPGVPRIHIDHYCQDDPPKTWIRAWAPDAKKAKGYWHRGSGRASDGLELTVTIEELASTTLASWIAALINARDRAAATEIPPPPFPLEPRNPQHPLIRTNYEWSVAADATYMEWYRRTRVKRAADAAAGGGK